MIVYGAHVATTMVPIYAELLEFALAAATPEDATRRWCLMAIYSPYAAMPLLLTAFMCANPEPFASTAAPVKEKSR